MDGQLETHRPTTAAAVGELVLDAARSGQAIYPCGGRTHWELGLPPSRAGMIVDITALHKVIDYPARDMTITVEAGMTVAQLQSILEEQKQRLPIDVPHADRATVGGIVAVNASGPRRYGFGTLRDYVIGISVVNDEGHEVKAGGRVVKNVAGYDLCKLYVGSMGTLSVITQLTLKLRPQPAAQALFAFSCQPADLGNTLAQLHQSQTRPVCIELLNPGAAQALAQTLNESWPSEWSIVVGFENNDDAMKWQVKQLIHEMGGRHAVSGTVGSCADPCWQALVEFAGAAPGPLSFKAGVPPGAVAAFCVEAAHLLEPVSLQAHAGNGMIVGHCLGDAPAPQVCKVRELASSLGGHLVVTRCPVAWKTAEFVWGEPRGDLALIRAVKEKLDPKSLFNPGRFVGGL